MWGQIEIDIPGFPRSFDDWGQIGIFIPVNPRSPFYTSFSKSVNIYMINNNKIYDDDKLHLD